MLEVNDPDFRAEMQQFWNDGYQPLGVLGFRVGKGELMTRRAVFPWLGEESKCVFDELWRGFTRQVKEIAGQSQ